MGTPMGMLLVMKVWKRSMTARATVVRRSSVAEDEHHWERVLHGGAGVGHEVREPGRAQVVRIASVEQLSNRPDAGERAVALHDGDHRREMMIELRGRGPHPDGDPDELRTGEPVAREHEADQRRVVVLRARREEDGLVGETEEREENDGRNEELDRELGRDQCAEQERDVCDVQSGVEHGALRAAEDREPGEQRHLDRARPAEVERAAERRIVSTGERAAAAAETEPFEGHAPEHGLLKCDRLVVPGAEASELAQARGEGAEEAPRPDVEDDLQDVDDVDRRGGSVALQAPRIGTPSSRAQGTAWLAIRRCRTEEGWASEAAWAACYRSTRPLSSPRSPAGANLGPLLPLGRAGPNRACCGDD